MDTFESEYWTELFEEALEEGREYLRRVVKELAPKGYFPLMEPGEKTPPEEMDMEAFAAMSPDKQRYYLGKMVERAGTETV